MSKKRGSVVTAAVVEMARLVRLSAAPAVPGEKVPHAIARAAHRLGLSRGRVASFWYGKARHVSPEELERAREEAVRRAKDAELGSGSDANAVGWKRTKRSHVERRLTILIADYLRALAKPGVWWSHWPNGEKRSPQTAGLLKRMGVNPGASDFIILSPTGGMLAMEVKREGTYQSPEQKAFQKAWQGAGGVYSIVRCLDDAVADFKAWGVTREDRSVVRPSQPSEAA